MNISDKARELVNNLALNEEFTKEQVCNELKCRDKSLSYCFSEMLKQRSITFRRDGQRYIYRRIEHVSVFRTTESDEKPVCKKEIKSDKYYIFAFSGNPEIVRNSLNKCIVFC